MPLAWSSITVAPTDVALEVLADELPNGMPENAHRERAARGAGGDGLTAQAAGDRVHGRGCGKNAREPHVVTPT